jgi:hypothetical protein
MLCRMYVCVSLAFFFYASHLGTAVTFVYTHACSLNTHYSYHLCINKPTTTLRSEDRVLFEIAESTDFVSDGHVMILLWFHVWETDAWNWSKRRLFLFLGKNPGAAPGSIMGIECNRVRSTTGGVTLHHAHVRLCISCIWFWYSPASGSLAWIRLFCFRLQRQPTTKCS